MRRGSYSWILFQRVITVGEFGKQRGNICIVEREPKKISGGVETAHGKALGVKENEVFSSCQKNITEMTKSYYENYHYLFGERDTYKTRPDSRNPTRIHWEGTKTWGD